MPETRRKLTTIFSADVYGYSRLMEADEEGTLARLKRLRDAMARLIDAHSGRVVNTWGDGLLAEFSSVVEAVRAAVDVQAELARVDEGGEPMLFRIGINLGDVIIDGNNIYGDGVNIAARLQESASPGGILISRTVYDQVRNKVSVGFDFLGDLAVKNLQEAVPSYAIRLAGGDDRLFRARQSFEKVDQTGPRTLEITYRKDKVNAGQVLDALQKEGFGIVDVSTRDPDLEDVFLSLTRDQQLGAS